MRGKRMNDYAFLYGTAMSAEALQNSLFLEALEILAVEAVYLSCNDNKLPDKKIHDAKIGKFNDLEKAFFALHMRAEKDLGNVVANPPDLPPLEYAALEEKIQNLRRISKAALQIAFINFDLRHPPLGKSYERILTKGFFVVKRLITVEDESDPDNPADVERMLDRSA